MNKLYILLFVLVVATSCEETVVLDTEQVAPQVVIEGLVTDHLDRHYVRVTETKDFYDLSKMPAITDAQVTVQDNEGTTYNYVHYSGDNPDSSSYYFPEVPYAGQIGNTYTLTVKANGKTYTAQDVLNPVTAIDSLTSQINEDEFDDPDDPGYYYEILFYAKEPQDREDYYLFKFYRNDSLVLEDETDIYFADDEFLGENIDGIPTAGYYKPGDTAKVEMYSISREAFVYYNDLITLLTSDGGMFSPPPANPRNNLSNDALGYFQASAVVSESIVVKPQ